MWLRELWFVLVGILFTGYFILEGFDYGVGMLHPFLNHTDLERRASLNAIGPIWSANEVWLVAAGGALFAAFPYWYATMFSGFYLALILILLALIVRGVGLEYRSQDKSPKWRATWDWLIFSGSLLTTILWGMAFANLVRGVPINGHMVYVGNFGTLFNGFSLWAALTFILLFLTQGGAYLAIKGDSRSRKHGRMVAQKTVWPALIALVIWFVWMDRLPSSLGHVDSLAIVLQVVAVLALILARFASYLTKNGWTLVLFSVSIASTTFSIFRILFPRVMVSSLNPAWSLTIYNASSTSYTLDIMSVTALIILPIILGYQSWLYWTFRKPVNDEELGY
ncbi:cytochrome d ubiquinol oxidase subunit II [Sulfobacillus thermosulfidooxidans DSM 9293]|uniref:Cytochrome d ubiquinol oxidase subunit II n=1 Tax=Sulfobacillus thermosulfidooxidans (strain DSM 9293 / VKM B-1269 / AT-1) TaxID=929705 RepID=A0A1W1W8R9_SULTA|nr:cytochrome d ubiquinol oxidase subunit II [Sulfobacillus thermosulfidooxidans]SMC02450.1 cytochrome d ubiquinol oxidase subunit II [Sulfobacillus thermosulfidooxidans DSM 9293]